MRNASQGIEKFMNSPSLDDAVLMKNFGTNRTEIAKGATVAATRYSNIQIMAALSRTYTREFLTAEEHAEALPKDLLASAQFRPAEAKATIRVAGHTISGLVSSTGATQAEDLLDCPECTLMTIDFLDGRLVIVKPNEVTTVETDYDVGAIPDEFHHPELHHMRLTDSLPAILEPIRAAIPEEVDAILAGDVRIRLRDGTTVMIECDKDFLDWIAKVQTNEDGFVPHPILMTTGGSMWRAYGPDICVIEIPYEFWASRQSDQAPTLLRTACDVRLQPSGGHSETRLGQ